MTLRDDQESSLVSGGDCFIHWHSSDRVITHDDLTTLIESETYKSVINGTTVIPAGVNYVLADSTAGDSNLTIAAAGLGLAMTVVKLVAGNDVIVTPAAGLINGSASYTMTAAYEVAKFKALGGNYYRVG